MNNTTTAKFFATILIFSVFILSPPRDAYCDCLATSPTYAQLPPPIPLPPSDPCPPTVVPIVPPPTHIPVTPTPIPVDPAPIPVTPTPIPVDPTPIPVVPIPEVPPPPPPMTYCPRHMLKLATCADIPGIVHVVMGNPPSGVQCCGILGGIAKVEMAACLCTAIKANILGININIPIAWSVLLSACQQEVPMDFRCEGN